jgi:hypothetical protein
MNGDAPFTGWSRLGDGWRTIQLRAVGLDAEGLALTGERADRAVARDKRGVDAHRESP